MQTLTEWQWKSLLNDYNFADGHARQKPFEFEMPLVESLSEIYWDMKAKDQKVIEARFLDSFFGLAGVNVNFYERYSVHYSSSLSIEITANICRKKSWRVGLLHPTFDNIPDIYRRHHVSLVPIEEGELESGNWDFLSDVECLFLVLPNNPTGFSLSAATFERLAQQCAAHNVTLILDFSFRFFAPVYFDHYQILDALGCSYITIEDTGKTLGHHDLKIGFSVASEHMIEELSMITDEILLNVSPFTISFLQNCFELYRKKSGMNSLRELIKANYATLGKLCESSAMSIVGQGRHLSVAWVNIDLPISTTELVERLLEKGIGILPGQPFCWNDPKRGEEHIRLALLRDPDVFERGLNRISEEIRTIL